MGCVQHTGKEKSNKIIVKSQFFKKEIEEEIGDDKGKIEKKYFIETVKLTPLNSFTIFYALNLQKLKSVRSMAKGCALACLHYNNVLIEQQRPDVGFFQEPCFPSVNVDVTVLPCTSPISPSA